MHRASKTAVVYCVARGRAEVFRTRFAQVWVGQNWSRFEGPWGVPGHCCPVHGEDSAGQCILVRAESDDVETSRPVYFWVLQSRVDRLTTAPDDPVVLMESVVGSSGVAYPFATTASADVLLPFADRHHPGSLVRLPHAVLFQLACRELADSDRVGRVSSPADTYFGVKASVLDPLATYHPVQTVYTAEEEEGGACGARARHRRTRP